MICFCKDMKCFGHCLGDLDSIIDTADIKDENQLYNSLMRALGRHKDVAISIIGIDVDFEIDLYFLRNRKITISSIEGMIEPKHIKLLYCIDHDYSQTSLSIKGFDVFFINSDQNAKSVDLKFKSISYLPSYGNKLLFQPKTAKYNLIAETIDFPLQVFFTFSAIRCIGNETQISIHLKETEKTVINIYNDGFSININNLSCNIFYDTIKFIKLIGTLLLNQSIHIKLLDDAQISPFFEMTDISYIVLEGNWSKAYYSNYFNHVGIISSSIMLYSPEITVNTPCVPFYITCHCVKFHIECSTTFIFNITSKESKFYTPPNLDSMRLDVSIMHLVHSRVSLYSANLNISIGDYIIGGDLTDTLPFDIVLSDYTVSLVHVTHVAYNVGNSISYYSYINVRSFVTEDKKDEYYTYLYSFYPIIQIPTLLSYYILPKFSILYTDDSTNIYGLRNECSYLNIKGASHNRVDYFLYFTGGTPSTSSRILCYGINCLDPFNKVSDLSIDLNNYVINYINNYQIVLQSNLGSDEELTINFDNTLISNCTIIVIDNFGYNINFLFPTNIKIKTLIVNNTYIKSTNDIYAEKLSLFNTSANEVNYKFSIACDALELDITSMPILRKMKCVITNIFISKVDDISFIKDQIAVNNQIIEKIFVSNCTFICGDSLVMNVSDSNEIPGFNVSLIKDTVLTYEGGWSSTVINKDININLNGKFCEIILKSNYIHDRIHYSNGFMSYKCEYDDSIDVCIYYIDRTPCLLYKNIINYSELDSISINYRKIYLHLSGFKDNPFEIDLFLFNRKQVIFNGISDAQKINIELSNSIDCDLTAFTFNNVEIRSKTAGEMEFGCIESTNSVFEGFNTVDIKVNVMKCSFKNLASFKSVYVKSELIVSGNLVISGSSVFFAEHTSLQLFINDQCKIIYKSLGIKIGESTFTFLSSKSMVKIYHLSYQRMEIVGETQENAMKTEIFIAIDTRIDFSGTWSIDNKIFEIISTSQFSIGLGCNVPIDIKSMNIVNIEALTDNCGIIGSVNNVITVSTLNNIETQVSLEELTIETFQSMEIFLIHVSSPYVDLVIERITTNLYLGPKINFVFAFDENRIATISVIEQIPFNIELTEQSIYIQSLIYGELKNDDEYTILKKNITFLDVVKVLDVYFEKPLYFNSESNLTHGFNQHASAFKIMLSKSLDRIQLTLYASQLPSHVPYSIQYSDDKKTLRKMFDSIQKKNFVISINILKKMSPESPLPLSFFTNWDNNISIALTGVNDTIYIDKLVPCIKSLIIKDAKVTINQSAVLQNMESISLSNVKFISKIKVGLNKELIVDMKSFVNLLNKTPDIPEKFKSFHLINANYIIFTEEGWIFKEDVFEPEIRLRKANIEKVHVQCKDFVELNIAKPRKQAKIHGFEISFDVDPNKWYYLVIFGSGWSSIKDIDGLSIIPSDPYSSVLTLSNDYPSPSVIQSNIVLSELNEFSNDEIWMADGYEPESDVLFELDYLPIEKAIVHCRHLILKDIGNSNYILMKTHLDYGIYEIEFLDVRERALCALTSFKITRKIELKSGSTVKFEITESINHVNIIMHWVNNTFPLISFSHSKEPLGTPNRIIIYHDEDNMDHEEYHEHMFRKSFPIIVGEFNCHEWLRKIQFLSNNSFFNDSNDLVLSSQCTKGYMNNEFYLSIYGEKQIPYHFDIVMSKSKLTSQMVIFIAISLILLAAIVFGMTVYCITKYKYEKLMSKKNSFTVSNVSYEQNEIENHNEKDQCNKEYKLREELKTEEEECSTEGYIDITAEEDEQYKDQIHLLL